MPWNLLFTARSKLGGDGYGRGGGFCENFYYYLKNFFKFFGLKFKILEGFFMVKTFCCCKKTRFSMFISYIIAFY